jgi:hypothetical protein
MTVSRSIPVHPRFWITPVLAMTSLGIPAVFIDRPATTNRVVILASPLANAPQKHPEKDRRLAGSFPAAAFAP